MQPSMKVSFPLAVFAATLLGCGGGASESELIRATREGRVGKIEVLLAQGADPDRRGGRNDWTPLMHAIHKNQKDSALALLDGGADVNARRQDGLTALMMAAGYGYTEMVRELLVRGADAYLEHEDGIGALEAAVSGVPDIDEFTLGDCQTATVQALLEQAPDLQLHPNFWGRLARWVARVGGCTEVLQLLERRN